MLNKSWIKNFDLLCWESFLSRLLLRLRLHYGSLDWLSRYCRLNILIRTSLLEGCHWISAQITEIIVTLLFFLLVACVEVEIDRFGRSLLLLHGRLTHTSHSST